MYKNDEFYCDSCKKRIKREHVVFNNRKVDLCSKCLMTMLNVDNAISNQNELRTICEISRITHVASDDEISF